MGGQILSDFNSAIAFVKAGAVLVMITRGYPVEVFDRRDPRVRRPPLRGRGVPRFFDHAVHALEGLEDIHAVGASRQESAEIDHGQLKLELGLH